MATTYTAFVASIAALSVTSVTRSYTYEPSAVNAADLPVSFPRLPEGIEEGWTPQTQGGWPTLVCDFVVLTSPWGLQTTAEKYAEVVTLMDNMSTALRASDLAKARVRWTIRADRVFVGDNDYHAVIATVESNG